MNNSLLKSAFSLLFHLPLHKMHTWATERCASRLSVYPFGKHIVHIVSCYFTVIGLSIIMGGWENAKAEMASLLPVAVSDSELQIVEAECRTLDEFNFVRVQPKGTTLHFVYHGQEYLAIGELKKKLCAVADNDETHTLWIVSDIVWDYCVQPVCVQIMMVEFEIALRESGCSEILWFHPESGCYGAANAPFDADMPFLKEVLRVLREQVLDGNKSSSEAFP